MKAVILAGGEGTTLVPLANHVPIVAFHLAGEPLLIHQIRSLRQQGIREIAILLGRHGTLRAQFQLRVQEAGIDLEGLYWPDELEVRGSAGALKPLTQFVNGDGCFIVVGNVYLGQKNLTAVFAGHSIHSTGLMVGVRRVGHPMLRECLSTTPDGGLQAIKVLHASTDRRLSIETAGLYWISPAALKAIPDNGYMDLKEQLIPHLVGQGMAVSTYLVGAEVQAIRSPADYWAIHRQALYAEKAEWNFRYTAPEEQVWLGQDVTVAPTARLFGPVVVGDGCRIDDHATIIGPTAIGVRSHIGPHACVQESILWDRTLVGAETKVQSSILTSGASVPRGVRVVDTIVLGEPPDRDKTTLLVDVKKDSAPDIYVSKGTVLQPLKNGSVRTRLSSLSKRVMDLVVAGSLVFVLFPLGLAIAAAIKIDSPGPVFFSQRRCTQDGQEFGMLKFRTMVADAESLQERLLAKNEVDGPVFKMRQDPRVTRVGGILRRTSLDELPQLFNVLGNQMSLVGPRPLLMSEMQYCPSWRDIRLMVKAGVTGLWQLDGRNSTAFSEWVKHDIAYVKGQSLKLDLEILLKTARNVLLSLCSARHQSGM
jgi:lipopolysaccharide/colanic/teichoic acid biosynthesis glycosyltransferase/carbonic anhydrase/acetyltransferase-like protein (isoleucine patch superfamily)